MLHIPIKTRCALHISTTMHSSNFLIGSVTHCTNGNGRFLTLSDWGQIMSASGKWAQWQQGLATRYIHGASDPQQNFQVDVQGLAGGPDTHALREPLSPLTVPITMSMCFLTEGHGESLAEAIIKDNLDVRMSGHRFTITQH
jgi:hypothetical protein